MQGDSGDTGSISGLGRFPEGGNGNLLQYSCLENPMDRGVWWATAHGVTGVGHNLVIQLESHSMDLFRLISFTWQMHLWIRHVLL